MKVNTQYTDIIYCCLFQVPVKSSNGTKNKNCVYNYRTKTKKSSTVCIYYTKSCMLDNGCMLTEIVATTAGSEEHD